MIVFRYLNRELATTISAITGVLLLIFLSNEFVRYLSHAATGDFSSATVLRLMLIEIPHLLGLLLPLGLFLAILLVYGRLYIDNEMTVLNACGLSRFKLIGLTLPITGVVMIIVAMLSLWLTPHLMVYREQLLAQTGSAMELETLLPGRFQAAGGGKQVFYVEGMSLNKQHMQNIFMAQLNTSDTDSTITPWIILSAAGGHQMVDAKTGDRFFVATNGRRYQGLPGHKDFEIVQFTEYRARIEKHVADITDQQSAMSTLTLLHAKKDLLDAVAELQWRISAPISALLLVLLAIPLSRVRPRQGRYAALLPAILAYIIYANLVLVGRNWIESGGISPVFGLWWIHGLMLLVIILVWTKQISIATIRAVLKEKQMRADENP
jgi:lipopolysaccharide export system permease protein